MLTGIPRVFIYQMAAASVDGGAALLRAESDYLEVINRSKSKLIPAGIYITGQVVYPVS